MPFDKATKLYVKTANALKWSSLGQVIQQSLQLGIYVALARLLDPREFGLMGMIVVLTGFANLFLELGFGTALVQRQDIEKRHLNSIFWLNTAIGLFLTITFVALSPMIASFYSEPVLRLPTMILSINFLLVSLNIVHRNILIKSMDFRRIFVVDTVTAGFSGLAAIAMAVAGLSIWSLVAQQVLLALSSTILYWSFSTWKPRLQFDRKALKELSGFSANLMGFGVLDYLTSNIDKFLIGKFIGSGPLGIYTRAYQLMMLPTTQVSSVATRVMFPALSAIQDDKEKVKRVYLQATRMIALVTFPAMLALLVLARPFVLCVFGDKWSGVIVVLQILCLTGMGHSIGTTMGWIYYSQGRTDTMFRWGLFAAAIRFSALAVGLRWGIVGVSVAHLISTYAFLTYPSWRLAGGLINLKFGEMIVNILQPCLCAVTMAVIIAIMGFLLPPSWPPWLYLVTQVLTGIAVYLALIHLFKIRAYTELRGFIGQQASGYFGSNTKQAIR